MLGLMKSPNTGESRQEHKPDVMLNAGQVTEMLRISRSTIWRLEQNNQFPKRIRISHKLVMWSEREILAWVKQKMAERPSAA